MQSGGATYAVTVTSQTTDTANPTYQQDMQTILTGFQLCRRPAPSPVAVPTTRKEIAVLTTHLAAPDTCQFAALAGILSIPLGGLIMLIAGLV